jgi:hypothetical protein
MKAQAQKDQKPALQVTDRFESTDPNLSSLQRYAELARKYDLIEHPVRVDRDEEGEAANIVIKAKFGGQTFEFESVAKAVHWLALVYHAADHAVEST